MCLQAKAGWGASPRRNNTYALRDTQKGGSRAERHVSHMPENQVCRRRRPHLQLLQHPVLRTLRRKGHTTLKQGKRIRKRSVHINGRKNSCSQIDWIAASIFFLTFRVSFFLRAILSLGITYSETFRRPWRKKITRKIKIERYPSGYDARQSSWY